MTRKNKRRKLEKLRELNLKSVNKEDLVITLEEEFKQEELEVLDLDNSKEAEEFFNTEAEKVEEATEVVEEATEENVKEAVKESKESYGNKELNLEQRKKLKKVKSEINSDVKLTLRFLRKSKFKKAVTYRNEIEKSIIKFANNKQNSKRFLLSIIIIMMIIPITIKINNYSLNKIYIQQSDYIGTVLNVTMNNETNKLDYSIKNISIKEDSQYLNIENSYWLTTDINTFSESYKIDNEEYKISNKTRLASLDINESFVYVQYKNEEGTGGKELLFSTDKPNNISTSGYKKESNRYYEKSSDLRVKAYTNSFYDSFLMLTESVSGGKLNTVSLKETMNNIENSMTYSISDESNITINFNELGSLSLNLIDEVKASPEIIYSSEDDILRIRNKNESIDYIFITSINNEKIGCNAEDLIATKTNGLYIHKDFEKEGYVGYKTFALKTDSNLYVIKLNEISHESLQNNIFEQLGINTKQVEIKKIQRVMSID